MRMNTGDVGQQQQQSLESAGIRHGPIFIGGGGSHPRGSTTTTERRNLRRTNRKNEWARVPSCWTGLTFRSIAIAYYAFVVRSASAAAVDTSNTTPLGSEPHVAIPGEPETAADYTPLDVWRKSLDQLTEEVILQIAPRVSVYVYDDPALDFSDLIDCYLETYRKPPWQDERADMAQDMGEIWLHRAMLQHPWRVLEPEKATVFYVPIYPVLSFKLLLQGLDVKCGGLTHHQRMKRAVGYLNTKSVYFKRFGGGDHAIVCAWWNCRNVFTPWQRMLLRRTVLGINERIANWANWGCDGRLLSIPYTASSVITTPKLFGGSDPEDRNIPFFFVGNARKRPERQNLQVVEELHPASVIRLGGTIDWGMNATEYARHIIRSKFCFCPRGDTWTSRRIFDAVAAGCIPVLTSPGVKAMPFSNHGLDYNEFAIVTPRDGFGSRENVTAVIEDIMSRSTEEVEALQRGVYKAAMTSMVYGLNEGPDFDDMRPLLGPATRFMSETLALGRDGKLWECKTVNLDGKHLSPRTLVHFPTPKYARKRWLSESETIINTERSLLFCAPPNAGSLQFRMLAKRMEGVEHWAISDDINLLFNSSASGLSLLDVENASLMNSIYRDNDGGWTKIGVVRDPVTRLVSAYIDYVHAAKYALSSSDGGEGHPGLQDKDLEWFEDIFFKRRRSRRNDVEDGKAWREGIFTGDVSDTRVRGGSWRQRHLMGDAQLGPRVGEEHGEGSESIAVTEIVGPFIPTFPDLIEALVTSMDSAPTAFRPISGLCGMQSSSFDSVIPFETLQKSSTEVLKSLPGGVWGEYGTLGWGPNGDKAFMEFDYGSVLRRDKAGNEDCDEAAGFSGGIDETKDGDGKEKRPEISASSSSCPSRARFLFEADSCDWTRYYPDEGTLERVGALYSSDYSLFGWYSLDPWTQRLRSCLSGNR